MAVDHNNPQSRNEEILIATIDGKEYDKLPQSRMEELLLELKETIEEGGGGGGTTNYENLSNQPQVNGETLIGDKTGADLGLVDAEEGKGLSTNDYDDTEKAAVAAATSAISAMKDGSEIDSFGDVEVALLDKADISDLGTAAAKDSTNAVTSGSTDLVESGAVKDAIDAAVAAAYHHAGTKTCAELVAGLLVAGNEGNVYNMTDSGTTTADFIEGAGQPIKAGDNVGIAKVSDGVYKFDLLSGFVDTTNFVQKSQTAGLLKNDGTVNDEIEGDVATLKSGLMNLDNEVNGDATVYPYADVITIEDAVPANLADCSVKIEPDQDLHGYDKPWVGGAGKNKLPLILADIKAANTDGTWNGNVYTINVGTFTVYTDDGGNITKIVANGTFSTRSTLRLRTSNDNYALTQGSYIVSKGFTNSNVGIAIETFNGTTWVSRLTASTSTDNVSFTVDYDGYDRLYVYLEVTNTSSAVNETFYPMIRLATEQDATFAPYTNISPISGHTEAVVTRESENVAFNTISGKNINASGVIINADFDLKVAKVTSGVTYTAYTDDSNSVYAFYSANPASGSASYNNSRTEATVSNSCFEFTAPIDGYIAYRTNVGYDRTECAESSSIQQYTIALGDTIYGGTVDFNTGVMTVTKAIKDLGDMTWTLQPTQDANKERLYCSDLSPAAKSVQAEIMPDAICSCYRTVTFGQTFRCYTGISISGTYVAAYDANYTDATVFTTDMTGQKIVYELATPTTIQLTPQQIQLLKGTNTLTASTGQISVTVNGVSGAIGAVQEQVNELAEEVADVQSGLSNKIGYIRVNVSGTEINNQENGWYYANINLTTLPSGAVPISVYFDGGWDVDVFYSINMSTVIARCLTSKTIGANNRYIRVLYYIP